tara:strand:+ start:7922 stop:8362 length:441 start_codon:yes stop_codon:yes gene_type:complete
MKNLKYLLYCFLSLFFAVSCSLEKDNKEILITDPPVYGYLTEWKEIELNVGSTNWEPISSGDTLAFFSDFAENVKPRDGAYIYNPIKLQIDVDVSGFFTQDGDQLSLFPNINTDRKTVKFEEEENSLIITNDLVNPNIQIKYEKID